MRWGYEDRDTADETPDQDAPIAPQSHANAFTAWTVGKRVTEVVELENATLTWHPADDEAGLSLLEGHSLNVPKEG
jgi:hypothetical protein